MGWATVNKIRINIVDYDGLSCAIQLSPGCATLGLPRYKSGYSFSILRFPAPGLNMFRKAVSYMRNVYLFGYTGNMYY